MTHPVTPATDEEVESIRREVKAGLYGPLSEHPALIARIDVEQARAEALYASCEQMHHEYLERAEKAEAERDAERKAHAETRKERDALDRHYVALVEAAKKKLADAGAVIDELRSRKSGIHYEDVRDVLGRLATSDASFGLLVEKMRGAVETQTAELRARAEKAEAERDRLRASLELVSLRQEPDGPCWCVFPIPKGSAHHITCARARALLGEVKP